MTSALKGEDNLNAEYARPIDDKYMVKGCEGLSVAVANLLYSSYGRYVVNYAHQTGINPNVSGFNKEEELRTYAKWVIQEFNEQFDAIKERIGELKKIEKDLSKEEIAEKYKAQQKARIKIYENIFDFQGKKKYCEEAESLTTIHSTIEGIGGLYGVVKAIWDELQ